MGMLDHWHPMLPARQLRKKPVGVKLAGVPIALFRTESGRIGALNDICPHRRMKLSQGKVIGERLMCRYHGWTFGCDGQGESPGTPKLQACASDFDAREEQGFIWVKSKESKPQFPDVTMPGWYHMCTLEHLIRAPLEVSMDNFCEIEHTPTTHEVFGYELDRMRDVTVKFEQTPSTVRVINQGPPKRLGRLLNILVGIKKGWVFNDDWTTHFSPLYTVYDHWWSDPKDPSQKSKVQWRLYMFYTPVDDNLTRVTTWSYAKSFWPVPIHGGIWPFRPVMRYKLDYEMKLDVNIVESLASHDTSLEGMKLSRFDKSLALNRERINRVYRGLSEDSHRLALRIAE